MFKQWKVIQKQKVVVELQKKEVEEQKKFVDEKQKEILDPINYPRRIQQAQIPSEMRLKNTLRRLKS